MNIKKIAAILDRHGIPYLVRDSRILADSMESGSELFSELIDLTEYNAVQLLEWLGY
jgi:hypothetical protein